MNGWQEIKLGDLIESGNAELQTGPFGTMLNASEYTPVGVPIIAVQDIENNKLVHSKMVYVNNIVALRLSKYKVKEGDIIFGRKGAVDRRALIRQNEHGWLQGSDCIRLRFENSIDPTFVSYQFGTDRHKEWMHQNAIGATMPSLNQQVLKLLRITLPPLLEQKAIAAVLSSLDDKIDLLHRQNKTLEAMAETLFRQWFVEEAEVQSSKTVLLGDLVESISVTHKFPSDKIVFLNTSDIFKGEILHHDEVEIKGLPGQAKKSVQRNDILFSEIRPANFRYAYISFDAERIVVSTKLMVLRSKNIYPSSFIYFYLTHRMTTDYLQLVAESRSGTFPQITFQQLSELIVNIPDSIIMQSVLKWCDSALNKTKFNHLQIQNLQKLRDNLLPKLMSGEVRVRFEP